MTAFDPLSGATPSPDAAHTIARAEAVAAAGGDYGGIVVSAEVPLASPGRPSTPAAAEAGRGGSLSTSMTGDTAPPAAGQLVGRSVATAPIPRAPARELPGAGNSSAPTATQAFPAIPSIARQVLAGSPPGDAGLPFAVPNGVESVSARAARSFDESVQMASLAGTASPAGPWASAAGASQSLPDLPPPIARATGTGTSSATVDSPSGPAAAAAAPAESASDGDGAAATAEADVDKLADRVWTIIRHKLHIERERQRGF